MTRNLRCCSSRYSCLDSTRKFMNANERPERALWGNLSSYLAGHWDDDRPTLRHPVPRRTDLRAGVCESAEAHKKNPPLRRVKSQGRDRGVTRSSRRRSGGTRQGRTQRGESRPLRVADRQRSRQESPRLPVPPAERIAYPTINPVTGLSHPACRLTGLRQFHTGSIAVGTTLNSCPPHSRGRATRACLYRFRLHHVFVRPGIRPRSIGLHLAGLRDLQLCIRHTLGQLDLM